MIKEVLNKKYEGHVSSGKFSASSVGCCWRKKYLELKGLYKEDFDEQTKRVFDIGNIHHRNIIHELISKGNGVHLCAAEVDLPITKYISGRIDAVVSDGKDLYIVDMKSASDWTIDQLKNGDCSENYKNQVLLYMYLTGIHRGLLLFIGKNKGQLEEVNVEYNEEKAKKLIQEIEDFFVNYVEKNIEPPRCKGEGMFGCKCCDLK